ncbi:MAG: hypothetical protein ACLQJR_20660 [Stellaceae bacterium]
MGAHRAVLLAMLAMVWSTSPASAQQIRPLTNAELNGLGYPTVSISSVEALIKRQIYDAAALAEEIEKEVGVEVVTTGLGAAAKAIKVLGELGEAAETGTHCKSGAGITSIVQKNNEIGTAHDNVIQLEHVLYTKLVQQYGSKKGQQLYYNFIRSSPVREFQQLNEKKPAKVTSCGQPSAPPPRQACNCQPPTRYPPTPEGGRESEAATNAYARCMTLCYEHGGLPPVRQ